MDLKRGARFIANEHKPSIMKRVHLNQGFSGKFILHPEKKSDETRSILIPPRHFYSAPHLSTVTFLYHNDPLIVFTVISLIHVDRLIYDVFIVNSISDRAVSYDR